MILTDKIVINLKEIDSTCEDISKFLNKVNKSLNKTKVTDIGNDIEYSIKNLTIFKKNLVSLIEEEGKKYQTDIFGNILKSTENYEYVEILFSQYYKNITSLRLYGKTKKVTRQGIQQIPNRYVFFNLENIFDPTIINLIYNSKEILKEDEQQNIQENYLEILQQYFAPVPFIDPTIKKKKNKLTNISIEYDDGKEKTFEEVLNQNEKLNSDELKSSIYDSRQQSQKNVDDISLLFPQIDQINKKIQRFQSDGNYLSTINTIQSEVLNKYDFSELFSYVDEKFQILPRDRERLRIFLEAMPTTQLFKKIDEMLPPKEKRKFFRELKKNQQVKSTYDQAIIRLEQFINNKLPAGNKIKLTKAKDISKINNVLGDLKQKFPETYCEIEETFNLLLPSILIVGILLAVIALPIILLLLRPKLPEFKLPSIEPDINLDLQINDLFGDYSREIDNNILRYISCTLVVLTKSLLELLNMNDDLEDFLLDNMFPLPELKQGNEKPKFEKVADQEWIKYVEYAYRLLIDTDRLSTEPQEINPVLNNLRTNGGIKNKLISKVNTRPTSGEICDIQSLPIASKLNKDAIKLLKKKSLEQLVQEGDIDSLLEKVKEYCFSETNDYFKTQNTDDELVIDILRFISASIKQQTPVTKPVLPSSPDKIKQSMSDMVEQIESILNQQEINSLLNGSYTEETAEIARNIAKLNFPDLTDRVDPIKYFRMLGKVIGSKPIPDLSNIKENIDLKIFGVKI